jgi:hypothetical protein
MLIFAHIKIREMNNNKLEVDLFLYVVTKACIDRWRELATTSNVCYATLERNRSAALFWIHTQANYMHLIMRG